MTLKKLMMVALAMCLFPLAVRLEAFTCDAPESCLTGDCDTNTFSVSISEAPSGNVSVGLHNCDTSTQACAAVDPVVTPGSVQRLNLSNGDCKVIVAPVQGLTWGDVDGCEDLSYNCS